MGGGLRPPYTATRGGIDARVFSPLYILSLIMGEKLKNEVLEIGDDVGAWSTKYRQGRLYN
jgi:hypothetical protein